MECKQGFDSLTVQREVPTYEEIPPEYDSSCNAVEKSVGFIAPVHGMEFMTAVQDIGNREYKASRNKCANQRPPTMIDKRLVELRQRKDKSTKTKAATDTKIKGTGALLMFFVKYI